MDVILKRGDLTARPCGAIALGILEGTRTLSGAAAAVDTSARGAIHALLASGDFTGRFLEVAVLYPAAGKTKRVILVGMGPRRLISEHRVRQVAAKAARRARELGVRTVATVAHGAGDGGFDAARAAQSVAEGSVLGHYRHTAYRSDPAPGPLTRIEIVESNAKRAAEMKPAVERGVAWGHEVAQAILDWRSTDGFTSSPPPYLGGLDVGQWRPTPPLFAPGLMPQFATMTPWGIESPDQFRPAGPPALDSDPYTADFDEVKTMGSVNSTLRSADQTDLAHTSPLSNWLAVGALMRQTFMAVPRWTVP